MEINFCNAFATNLPFSGNPAAVCIVDAPISTGSMRMIAAQLAQPETVFVDVSGDVVYLRWFTPTQEVVPGGNGTLCAAHVVLERLQLETVTLTSRALPFNSVCRRTADGVSVELPGVMPRQINMSHMLIQAFGSRPIEVREGNRDVIAVFEDEDIVRSLSPDFESMLKLDWLSYIATARGDRSAFVYRTFAPSAGLRECPGSGSALMNLTPYWHYKTAGVENMLAVQASVRGGEAKCRFHGEHITVSAKVNFIGKGSFDFELNIDDQVCAGLDCLTSWI